MRGLLPIAALLLALPCRAGEEAAHADSRSFELYLAYQGPHRSSYANLHLYNYNGPARPGPPLPPPNISLRPDEAQARAIIDFLTKEGFFRQAGDFRAIFDFPPSVARGPEGPCYLLMVPGRRGILGMNLGWGRKMLERLERFRGALDGELATAMDELLELLERHRREWYANEISPRLDWARAGEYSRGPWKYRHEFSRDDQGKVIGRWGHLYYRGKQLSAPEINDSLLTPWGVLYDSKVPQAPGGRHGWLPEPSDRVETPGKRLRSPLDALRYQALCSDADRLVLKIHPSSALAGKDIGSLLLLGEGYAAGKAPPGTAPITVKRPEAVVLLKHLAHTGWLGRARPIRTFAQPSWPGLIMYACTFPEGSREGRHWLYWNMGWGPPLLEKLGELRPGLSRAAAGGLDGLEASFEADRTRWGKLPVGAASLEDARKVLEGWLGGNWFIDEYEPPLGPVLRGGALDSGTYTVLPASLSAARPKLQEYARRRPAPRFFLSFGTNFTVLASRRFADEQTSMTLIRALGLMGLFRPAGQRRDPASGEVIPTSERPVALVYRGKDGVYDVVFGGQDGAGRKRLVADENTLTVRADPEFRTAAILRRSPDGKSAELAFYDCEGRQLRSVAPTSILLGPGTRYRMWAGSRGEAVVESRVPPAYETPRDPHPVVPGRRRVHWVRSDGTVREMEDFPPISELRFAAGSGFAVIGSRRPGEQQLTRYSTDAVAAWRKEVSRCRGFRTAPTGFDFSVILGRHTAHTRRDGSVLFEHAHYDPDLFRRCNPGYVERAGRGYEKDYLTKAVAQLAEAAELGRDERQLAEAYLKTFIYEWLEARVEYGPEEGIKARMPGLLARLDERFRSVLDERRFAAYLQWRAPSNRNALGFLFAAAVQEAPKPQDLIRPLEHGDSGGASRAVELRVAAAREKPNGRLVLTLSITNTGRVPLLLPWPKYIDTFVTTEIVGPDGKKLSVRHPGHSLGHGKCPGANLDPGETWRTRLARMEVPGTTRSEPIAFPAPGAYRLKCLLDTTDNPAPWFSFWKGKSVSPEVAFEARYPQDMPEAPRARLQAFLDALSDGEEVPLRAVTTDRGYAALEQTGIRTRAKRIAYGKLLAGLEIRAGRSTRSRVSLVLGPAHEGFALDLVRVDVTWKVDGLARED
jgi:hypothetical protein